MPLIDWFLWPEKLPCAREQATVLVVAEAGARLGWDDPTAAGSCGRDEPTACAPALAAQLDRDGLLSCAALSCTWEIDGADFDVARLWTEGPIPMMALRCPDRATGARLRPNGVVSVTWRDAHAPVVPSGTNIDPTDDAAVSGLARAALEAVADTARLCEQVGCSDRALAVFRSASDGLDGLAAPEPLQPQPRGWRRAFPDRRLRELTLSCPDDGPCRLRRADSPQNLLAVKDGMVEVAEWFRWLPDGLVVIDDNALALRPQPTLTPASLPAVGPPLRWTARAGALPKEVQAQAGSGYFYEELPTCATQAWSATAPDLDGDRQPETLWRTRVTTGADCKKPTYTLTRTFVQTRSALIPIGASGGPEESTERDITGLVRMPDGALGLTGTVVHLPCCDQGCTLRGAWAGLLESGRLTILADDSGTCPREP